jgi:hypothetical protein
MVMMSAPALATPRAMVPIPATAGTFTEMRVVGLAVRSSSTIWARSSME